jgi:hypothetical protein
MPNTLKNLTLVSVGGAGWRATRLSTFSTPFSLYGPLWKPRHLAPPRALSNAHGRRSMSIAQGRTCTAPTPGSPTSPRSWRTTYQLDCWRRAIADAATFPTKWGAEAQALGWMVPELFGLHPVPEQPAPNYNRLARVDDMGLLWLLRGRPVIAITSTDATIRCDSGATLKFYRRTERAPAEIVTVAPAIGDVTQIVKPAPQIVDDVAEIAKGATA